MNNRRGQNDDWSNQLRGGVGEHGMFSESRDWRLDQTLVAASNVQLQIVTIGNYTGYVRV